MIITFVGEEIAQKQKEIPELTDSLSDEDADLMIEAIEEGREKVDHEGCHGREISL